MVKKPELITSNEEIPNRIIALLNQDYVKDLGNLTAESFANLRPSIIKGVGEVYGHKLEKNFNIKTILDLSSYLDVESLSKTLGVDKTTTIKWLISADSLLNFSKGSGAALKIIVTGLQGSGKTSLIFALNALASPTSAPMKTPGLEQTTYKFIGFNIPILELGVMM